MLEHSEDGKLLFPHRERRQRENAVHKVQPSASKSWGITELMIKVCSGGKARIS